MTTIERLGIRGIRSYDQDEETVVRFHKPLTIFCGHNGSGKSTVIEAVKMAVTGDLPPVVDKGAAFINDPRIHSNTETRAKIRLKFTNINGDPYLVNRQFSLVNKPNKRQEFKTTEQTIQKTERDGKKSSTSFRLAHLNALLPEIMGVSKPVLDNVIFVHQEESLWPLGDPKKLKEKFDDIFAATRYTKALDVIRKYRKEQAAELKLVSKDLQFFEEKVKALDKLKMEHEKLNNMVHNLDNAVVLLKMDIKELDQEVDGVKLLKAEYSEVREKLNEWKSQEKTKSEFQRTIYSSLDEDLSHLEIADITIKKEKLKKEKENLHSARVLRDKRIDDARAEEELRSNTLRSKSRERGFLDSEAEGQERRLARILQIKTECSNGFFSASAACPQTNASTDNWNNALREEVYKAEKDFRELQNTCRKNEDDALDALNEAQKSLEQTRAEAERLKNMSADFRKQAHSKHVEMLRLSKKVAGRDSKALKARQTQLKAELEGLRETSQMEKLTEECTALRRQYDEITNKIDELSLKETSWHEKERMHSRIRVLQEELAARDKVRNITICTFAEELAPLSNTPLSLDLPPQTLRKEAESVLNSLTAASSVAVAAAQRKVEASIKSCKEADVDVACRRDRLKEVETSLTTTQMKIKACVDKLSSNTRSSVLKGQRNAEIPRIVDVDETLEEVRLIIERSSSLKACIGTVREIRGKEKDFVVKYNRCPTCSCEFKARARREKVLEFIDNRIKNEVHDIKKANQSRNKGEYNADMELLRSLKEMITRHDDLSKGLSEAQTSLREAEEVLGRESLALEHAQRDAKEAAEKTKDTDHAQELIKELKQLDSVIEELERKKGDEEALCGSTFQNSEERISEIQTTIKVSREERERIRKDLNLKESERKTVEEKWSVLNTNLHSVNSMLEEGMSKDMEISDLRNKASELQADAAKADKDFAGIMQREVPPKQKAVSELACEKEAVRVENQHQLEKNERALKSKQKLLEEWDKLVREAETYERSGKGGRRERLERELAKAEEKISALRKDIETWSNEARADSEAAEAIDRCIDNLSNNITCIDLRQELSSIRISIKDCEREMEQLTKRAGGKSIDDKLESLIERKQDIIASKAATEGKRFATERNRDEKRKELQEAEKEGSRGRFDESRIKHQTMSLACADLDRYYRALDKALMAFHHLKMTSINKSIKELWQKTYSGNDIDSIAIVSDVGDETRSTATVRRSYNYRVEMKRGDAWLDMRGRCSAGQKVLACLVIRLALAESFCTNCGILALDEPTTNLDEANIESLAEALSNIIDTRKTQSTFQLILITHDFQFIERIGARSFCNEYYLVYKDPNGFSKIKAQSILGIE